MMNKRTMFYTGCLAVLLGADFFVYSAAEPFLYTAPKPAAQEEKYDLILAVPRGLDAIFANIQTLLADKLGAQQSRIDPRLYQIKSMHLDFTTNHRKGVPMRPHISLKGIPSNCRPDAENVFTPDLFSQLAIPQSIRLVGLFAIKSELPGHSDKLFIVADFADNPTEEFDRIARQLDDISEIPRRYPYLHHITLAKLFPFKSGPQQISDGTVQKIQDILDSLQRTMALSPDYNRDFPIDHIEYSYWQEDPSTAQRTRQLWSSAERAINPAHIEPSYQSARPIRETSQETIHAVAAQMARTAPRQQRLLETSQDTIEAMIAADRERQKERPHSLRGATTSPEAIQAVMAYEMERQKERPHSLRGATTSPEAIQAVMASAMERQKERPYSLQNERARQDSRDHSDAAPMNAATEMPAPAQLTTVYTFDANGQPTLLSNHYIASNTFEIITYRFTQLKSAAMIYQCAKQGKSEQQKYELMKSIVRAKFYYNSRYRAALMQTGNARIINNKPFLKTHLRQHPTFWGVPGQNMLGKILEEVREEIRQGTLYVDTLQKEPADAVQTSRFNEQPRPSQALPPQIIQLPMPPAPAVIQQKTQSQEPTVTASMSSTQPSDQKFPLHAAIKAGNKELIVRLVEQTKNVNISDSQGDSPLHLAADKGDLEIVKMLLAKKGDAFARDSKGLTPYVRALVAKNHQVSDYLATYKIECPICMNEFKATDLRAIGSCGHRICDECLDRLYERAGNKPACPTCRGDAYPKPAAQ